MAEQSEVISTPISRVTPIYKDPVLLQLVALVFLIDQFTKFLVREFLAFRESFPAEGFFRITHTYTTGGVFGLFRDQNFPLILVAMVGITILVLLYQGQRQPTNLLRLSLGLQLGGAAGNLLDRLRLGHVTDFADVGPWPVFNLADASIITGLVVLVWVFMRFENRERETAVTSELGPQSLAGAYAWCPVCDGEMETVPNGWRCTFCGVVERIE